MVRGNTREGLYQGEGMEKLCDYDLKNRHIINIYLFMLLIIFCLFLHFSPSLPHFCVSVCVCVCVCACVCVYMCVCRHTILQMSVYDFQKTTER